MYKLCSKYGIGNTLVRRWQGVNRIFNSNSDYYVVGRFLGKSLERNGNRWIQNYLIKYLVCTRHFYEKHGEKSIIISVLSRSSGLISPFLQDYQVLTSETSVCSPLPVRCFGYQYFHYQGIFSMEYPGLKKTI